MAVSVLILFVVLFIYSLWEMPLENGNFISNGRLVDLASHEYEMNNVSVKQYEPRLLDSEGDYKMYTATLLLSGDYVGLVKTLQYWEDNMESIKVSSLQFEHDEKNLLLNCVLQIPQTFLYHQSPFLLLFQPSELIAY